MESGRAFLVSALTLVCSLSLLHGGDARAAVQRTFVSTSGSDAASCSLTAPCRGFAAAIAQTSSGGEVIVLDSGGYGIVTITKSVAIIAPPGVYAGITVFAGFDGVTVAAGPTDKVLLRGLTINGQGGNYGIHVTSGRETHIEDCTVANLTLHGILIEGGATVHIARAVVRGNANDGVRVQPSAAITIAATIADSTLTKNGGEGFLADLQAAGTGATVVATVTRVTASKNGASGFIAGSNNFGTVAMTVADSIAVDNGGNGVLVGGNNTLGIVSGSTLVGNFGADLAQNGAAVLRTSGTNALTGRGVADVFGTLTANPPQ